VFEPSADTGLLARRQVYGRLAESLAHIFERSAGIVPFDEERARRLVASLDGNIRFNPRIFPLYFDCLAAIGDNDLAETGRILGDVTRENADREPPLRILTYSGAGMSPDAAAMIARHFSLDELEGAAIAPLPHGDAEAAIARFEAAIELMRGAAPRTFAEIEATISEIILAGGSEGGRGSTFDGVSSLGYWGAVLVNASNRKSLLETCEMLAHECAHNVLFGLSPRTFFVLNDESERHVSPLREDPRPLDGIFHAAFVLARMHFAVAEMLDSGRLEEAQRKEARTLLKRSAGSFADGAVTLEAHARFTEEGRAILTEATAYMAARGEAMSSNN
jgi:hypothetical protein